MTLIKFATVFIPSYQLDTLIIDTGSANTWVGAGKAFVRTSTSVQTSDNVVSMYVPAQSADLRKRVHQQPNSL